MSTLGAVGPVMVAMLESGIFPTGLLFHEEDISLVPTSPEVPSLTKFASTAMQAQNCQQELMNAVFQMKMVQKQFTLLL